MPVAFRKAEVATTCRCGPTEFSAENYGWLGTRNNEPPEGVGTAGGSLRARATLKPKLHPSTPP